MCAPSKVRWPDSPVSAAASKLIFRCKSLAVQGGVLRVLIVDDHERIRRGIRVLLSGMENIDVCGEAVDGHDAITKAKLLIPDVIIMDMNIPSPNGIEATGEIRRILPNIKIVLISQHEIPQAQREALRAGAVTYLPKSSIWRLVEDLRKLQRSNGNGDGNGTVAFSESNIAASPNTEENSKDRADLESLLRDCEERFHSAFDQMAVGMCHIAEDGRWIRFNQKLCDIVGYTRKEMQHLRLQDITHPADLTTDIELIRAVAAGDVDQYFEEKRYIRKDGRIAWVRLTVNAVRDPDHKLKYCLHVAEDISASKETEEKLFRASYDLQVASGCLSLVAEQAGALLTHCSRDLRYLWVNQNYADWLRKPAEKIIGLPIVDVVGREAFQTLQPHFDQVLSGKKIAYEEDVTYDRIGQRHISATYSPTFDSSGIADGWLALLQDVTAAKRSEPLRQSGLL